MAKSVDALDSGSSELMLMEVQVFLAARKQQGHQFDFSRRKLMVKIISSENFDSFIATGLVLVDFFAEWCGPCRMLTPVLENLAAELPHVTIGKINIDENNGPAEKYEVSSIPTTILFKNGKEVARIVGLKDKEFLTNLINKHA